MVDGTDPGHKPDNYITPNQVTKSTAPTSHAGACRSHRGCTGSHTTPTQIYTYGNAMARRRMNITRQFTSTHSNTCILTMKLITHNRSGGDRETTVEEQAISENTYTSSEIFTTFQTGGQISRLKTQSTTFSPSLIRRGQTGASSRSL